jgi:hypothetical protein
VNRCVLDAGALIALEHDDRAMWAALKLAAAQGDEMLVPRTALALVWRGSASQARLARALHHCVIAGFEPVARAVGELCAKTKTRDICDAHVALVASTDAQALYTSDPADMQRLLRAAGRRRPQIVRC